MRFMSAINIEISPAKLKKARGKRSRKEVAEAIGSSRQRLWQIEEGKHSPNADTLAKLCILYGVQITDITRAESNGKKKATV